MSIYNNFTVGELQHFVTHPLILPILRVVISRVHVTHLPPRQLQRWEFQVGSIAWRDGADSSLAHPAAAIQHISLNWTHSHLLATGPRTGTPLCSPRHTTPAELKTLSLTSLCLHGWLKLTFIKLICLMGEDCTFSSPNSWSTILYVPTPMTMYLHGIHVVA